MEWMLLLIAIALALVAFSALQLRRRRGRVIAARERRESAGQRGGTAP